MMDIKALVAEAKMRGPGWIERADTLEDVTLHAHIVSDLLPRLADALEATRAVVEAAQEYREKNESHMAQSPFARKLIEALDDLAALDAKPGEG